MKKYILPTLFIAALILSGCSKELKDGQYAEIAKCLTDKGVKFYGAYWCPHCADQKKVFGDDLRYVSYVECDPKGAGANPAACKAAGVQRYPTWGFPGQENIVGVQQPADLAKKANCDVASASETATATTTPATTTSTATTTAESTQASTQSTQSTTQATTESSAVAPATQQ